MSIGVTFSRFYCFIYLVFVLLLYDLLWAQRGHGQHLNLFLHVVHPRRQAATNTYSIYVVTLESKKEIELFNVFGNGINIMVSQFLFTM
jgi:hypothetical protein